MPRQSLTGTRVRDRRIQAGLRQADVARQAGISASYLNLIEHNRRRVGEDVLARLATALGIAEDALREGAEGALIADLRAAAGSGEAAGEGGAELDRIEDYASRFPGWAGLTAQLSRRIGQMERTIAALNDRMTHDPHLSQALHEVLSAVSSVRSTAAILAETEDIDPDWRRRFHGNLHADSERLAAGAESLVAYLDSAAGEAEAGLASPQEEVDAWLESRGWAFPELDGAGDAAGRAAAIAAEIDGLASGAARALARRWLDQAMDDAQALPPGPFREALAAEGPEPARLAARFGVPVLSVFRRLASQPDLRAGLVICDASGALVFRKPAEGFVPPRFETGCPLWPLYAALGRPMAPVEARIEIAGRGGRRYLARAFCQPGYPQGFGGPELREAAMLILPETLAPAPAAAAPAQPVGMTCRICPMPACPARREASILSESEARLRL